MIFKDQTTQNENLDVLALEQTSTDSQKVNDDLEVVEEKIIGEDVIADDEDIQYLEKLERVDDFINYLKNESSTDGIPPYSSVMLAEKIWDDLKFSYSRALPVPLVSLGSDGGVLFTFKQGDQYLELEIFESGVEVFYENESTNETDFEKIVSSYNIIESLETYLLEISNSK